MGYRERFLEFIEKIKDKIIEHYKERLVTIAIFGSVGRDCFRPDSDIDILIVAEDLPKGRIKRAQEFNEHIEKGLLDEIYRLYKEGIPLRLSPLFKTPDEVSLGSPLFLDMTEDVKILYDKGDFFKRYLEELKDKLKKLGARKVFYKGGYYWELKPDYKHGEIIEL